MKIRKVSADVLDRPARRERARSPRQQRRIALEREVESAIKRANEAADAAFLIELDKDEKAPTIRLAFNRSSRWMDTGHVFATTVGTPLDAAAVTRSFQRLLDRAGLPRCRFHDLRQERGIRP